MFQLEQPTGVNTLLRLAGLSNNGYEIKPESKTFLHIFVICPFVDHLGMFLQTISAKY